MQRIAFVCLLCFAAAACSKAQPPGTVKLQQAFPNLTFNRPVDFQDPGDSTNRLFVIEQQNGLIRVFDNSPSVATTSVFLNIKDRIVSGGNEQGLLGLAFHPDFKNNHYFYVYYTGPNPDVPNSGAQDYGRIVVARYSTKVDSPMVADRNSEQIVLTAYHPYQNHNGGKIAFGPDGYLYIGIGDGGSGGDPGNRAQNRDSLLGKILRIDVDHTSSGRNYAIPADNPFAGNTAGYREEIYAYGMRNPWRYSFDPATGKLWCGDVGQDKYEEIDIIEKGKNYGWHIKEGYHCYPSGTFNCDSTGLTSPIWEYSHSGTGGVSITGGYVYHGKLAPELTGKYIYADLSGLIWALSYDGTHPATNTLLLNSQKSITSFGVDHNNELYICAFDGKIYKFDTPSDVSEETANSDKEFLLANDPNPFNTSTVIRYTLLHSEPVRLTVYDLLGRVIATLVDKMQEPGNYSAMFDAGTLPAGMYYCTLTAGSRRSENRRMIVVK